MTLEEAPVEKQSEKQGAWSRWGRIGFRFACIYWAIYCLPSEGSISILGYLPWADSIHGWLSMPMKAATRWVGFYVFHLDGQSAIWHPSGGGDTAQNYLLCLCTAALALLGTVIWSVVDERPGGRREYTTAYAWLRLVLRFTLAAVLLGYGFGKIFPDQFAPPALGTLTETYGESSPMKLLWTFMGASTTYTIFGGLAEVVPGLLLLFRRTSTLGAMCAAAVMLNVVLLNFSYDVPVKLFSLHLLAMSLFLLLPDVVPMWRFFVLRRAAALTGVWMRRWERRPLRIAAYCLQALVIAQLLYRSGVTTYRETRSVPVTRSPMYGVWVVDVSQGGPAKAHWQRLVAEDTTLVEVYEEGGPRDEFDAAYAGDSQTLRLTGSNALSPEQQKGVLHWAMDSQGRLTLSGTWNGAPASVSMHRVNAEGFVLQTRGFHWVQEYPYSR